MNYQQVGVYSSLQDARPEQVIQVMLDTCLTRLAQAKGHMERGEVAAKAEAISKALGIVEGLQMSLDTEQGGQLAANLTDLYDYLARTLLQANLENKPQLLDEVAGLLLEIKTAWDQITTMAAQPSAS
jgi:flagellar protein FliS